MAIEVMKKVVIEESQNPLKKKKKVGMEFRSDAAQKAFMKKASDENAKNIRTNSEVAQYLLDRDKKAPK